MISNGRSEIEKSVYLNLIFQLCVFSHSFSDLQWRDANSVLANQVRIGQLKWLFPKLLFHVAHTEKALRGDHGDQ